MTALLVLLAALAAAQPGPARDPRAPRDDLRYLGSLGYLRLVQSTPVTQLLSDDGGVGGVRHYYLAWTSALEAQPEPMLVFVEPSDGVHPPLPRAALHLAKRTIDRAPATPGSRHPFQVWRYGDLRRPARGFFAAVWGMSRSRDDPTGMQPILWWGLPGGSSLEDLSPPRAAKVLPKLLRVEGR